MTGGRFLTLLIIAATGLLAAALAIAGGSGAGPGDSGSTIAAEASWMQSVGFLTEMLGSISRRELSALLIGVFAGWLLRWLYALPWGAFPRAVSNWLLGWRTSAAMVGLAIGCTVILLFY
jgi:hypothetical protein